MRKKSTFLILLATCLLAIVPLEGFAYKSKLIGLSGNFSESGGVYTVNNNGNNNLVRSHVEASAFSLEAKVQVVEGDRMSFVFGSIGSIDKQWYGVELLVRKEDGMVNVKAFQDHGIGLMLEKKDIEANVNNPIPFKINVTAEGQLTIFVEGNQVAEHTIPDYITGSLGILTWQSKVVLTDLFVDFGGDEGYKVELENMSGDFYTPNPSYTIYDTRGDNFIFSETEATAFSAEGNVTVLGGDRMSILFGYKGGDVHGTFAVEILKKDGLVDIKGFQFGITDFLIKKDIPANTSQPIPYKIEVSATGGVNIYVEGNKINDEEIQLNEYQGGRLGLLTWNSKVRFSDVVIKVDGQEKRLENLSGDYFMPTNTYIVNKNGGNNMVSSSTILSAFSYAANIEVLEGDRMSLVFGSAGSTGAKWYGVELLVNKGAGTVDIKAFQDNGAGLFFEKKGISVDVSQPIPFKIDVTAEGKLTVFVNNIQTHEHNIPNYLTGRLGLITWQSKVKVSDILVIKKDQEVAGNFATNTTGWAMDPKTNGIWMITADGLYGVGNGNSPYFSSSSASNFILESDMKYLGGAKSGGLIFRANADHSVFYTIDLMNDDRQGVRILKFYKNKDTGAMSDLTLGGGNDNLKTIPGYTRKDNFKIRIEAIQASISVYIDDHLVTTASDNESLEGCFGVTNYSSEIIFQNMYFSELTDLPLLTGLTCTTDLSPAYSSEIFKYNAFVPFETTKVSITPTAAATNDLFVDDQAITSGQTVEVDLEEGMNIIWIKVQDKTSKATTITALNVKRSLDPATVYTEKYRPQFHYTPEANWVNDPNGMVYFEGEYHLFYQYHPYGKQWGPMHWGHAISADMVNWKEYPIALYPDKFGTIFSGSAVVDVNNTTGFFTDTPGQKGLVAIYTNAGATQQQSIAYSKDKGRTWIKYNEGEPVIKTADDPLHHGDFRDPKVFWHAESNKWMMVIAGGPLRFYSSSNLKEWNFESGYNADQTLDGKSVKSIYTECPDFFKLPVEGASTDKWILTKSGKEYMIGDFTEIDGKWYFIPDSSTGIAMNFGHDNYAAQTYSDTPDGRRIMVNWMTNFDYSSDLANVTDPYNGTFTMAYELNLKQTASSGIKLYQTPVSEYENLRFTPYTFTDITVQKDSENILKNIQSKQFEIVAEITPEEGNTQFGFSLRTGANGQLTKVYYNTSTQRLFIDRTRSGKSPNAGFNNAFGQTVKLIDGKLKLRLFVDWSTIEVFANDGEAIGTLLIFPDMESTGMEFFVKGNPTKCNIEVYPLKSIWREETDPHTGFNPIVADKSDFGVIVSTSDKMLHIELTDPSKKEVKYELFNMEGKLCHVGNLTYGSANIPLNQGIYALKLSDNNTVHVKKIAVQ